jgi:cytochrome c-type biogenesis protein CcmH
MRILPFVAAVLLSSAAPAAAPQFQESLPPAQETWLDVQTRNVASQLRCVVCQGLSIQDSPAGLAKEMRTVVREQLAAGRTPEQVKQYFVDKYGEMVLLQPDPAGFNLLVYVLPVAMLLLGGVFVMVKARQWTRRSVEQRAG